MSGSPKAQKKDQPEDRLRRLRRAYDRQQYSSAGRQASRLIAELPQGTGFDTRDAAFLIGLFAYAKSGEVERGWQLLEQHTSRQAEYMDVCYAGCYLAYQRADYDAAERWGARYLEAHADPDGRQPYADTRGKLHEVLNTLACAAKDRGDDAKALEFADRAIGVAPDYPLAYLNGALVAQRSGQTDRARAYIAQGLEHCGEVEELRMVENGLLRDRKISLCMIVKDEEEMLPGALDSVRDVVDEIVIVDTGSTDRTVAIAESYGARIYHHAWENDFSKSRNLSIDYATGDWVLILDADERLDRKSVPLLRKLAQTCSLEGISFSVYNVDLDNDHVSFLPSIRMFRSGRGYGYEGIVHNQINIPRDTPIMRAPLRIDHYGYTPSIAEKRRKFERTTGLLAEQLAANPDDAFAHFNMAQILRGGATANEYHRDIVDHATRVTELIDRDDLEHRHILLMAYHQLASSHFALDEYDQAEEACRTALDLKPDFIDCLMTLGHVLSVKKKFAEARETFLDYLRVREAYDESEESTGFILLNLETQHQAHYGLGLVEESLGNDVLAIEWYRKVLLDRDDYLETHLRLGRLLYGLARWEEAREIFAGELKHRPDSFWGHFCVGDTSVQTGDWEQAHASYLRAHEIDARHTSLPLNLATTSLRLGNAAEAGDWLGRLDPEIARWPQARRLAAEVAAANGQLEQAREHYVAYLDECSEDVDAWSDLGNVYFRREDYAEAAVCYQRALTSADPSHPAKRNLALAHLKSGRRAEARSCLSGYVETGRADSDAICLLADLLAEEKRYQEALPFYEQYISSHPEDSGAVFRLANSYRAMGQQDAAIIGFRHVLSKEPDFEPARRALSELSAG